jgi:hypothetical protein
MERAARASMNGVSDATNAITSSSTHVRSAQRSYQEVDATSMTKAEEE